MSDADEELFLVMLDALDRVALYIRGFDLESFMADQRTIDAVAMNFVVIGECARRLSPEGKLNPAGPWQKMASLRHRIAHGYASIRPDRLWRTAFLEAAELRPKVAALLGIT